MKHFLGSHEHPRPHLRGIHLELGQCQKQYF